MFGSVSYLIFSDKILSGVVIVYLSSVCCCIFSSFLFIWIECIYGYHDIEDLSWSCLELFGVSQRSVGVVGVVGGSEVWLC